MPARPRGVPDPADDSFDPDVDLDHPEDASFLADWYAERDAADSRHAARTSGDPAAPLPSGDEDRAETNPKLDVLRRALLTSKDLDNLPSPRPVIDHILYFDTPSWVIGRPGSGKSFVALDWAGHVGSGLTWNGFATTRTNVIYVCPESPGGVKLRVRAWEKSMSQEMCGVWFLPIPVNAIHAGEFSALAALAVETHAGLIVLDTQARMTVGLEENSSKDMGIFVEKIDQLRMRTRACILTVHHTPRGGEHLRGSTALEGAAGTIITVKKEGDQITVAADPEHGGKTKDIAAFDPVDLRLVPSGESAIVGVSVNDRSGRDLPMDVARSLRDWWQQHGSDYVSVSLLDRTGLIAERTFYRHRKTLVDQGVITVKVAGRTRTYSMNEGNPYSL